MKKYFFILMLIFSATLCLAKENSNDERYEIEIAEVGDPGTLVVKVWCYNKKPKISDDIAKKNAIKGVLFKGVSDSGRMKGRKALVTDGYDNHKDYFDSFFDEAKYAKFARVAMNSYVEQNSLIKVDKLYKIGKIVVISYNDLRKQLETDKIVKGLNYGF